MTHHKEKGCGIVSRSTENCVAVGVSLVWTEFAVYTRLACTYDKNKKIGQQSIPRSERACYFLRAGLSRTFR